MYRVGPHRATMPLLSAIPLIVLCALSACCAVYYAVVWWRVARSQRSVPTLLDGLELARRGGLTLTDASVCVVIPAHNERDVIGVAAKSLCRVLGLGERVRVVFVLDRCTDDTEAVLRDTIERFAPEGKSGAFEVILNDRCPEGWAGKTHAVWRGVTDSRGAQGAQLLCFADADTVFEPGTIRAAAALMEHRGLHMVSLLSTLIVQDWYERTAQPAAGIELVRQFPLDLVNRPESKRAFANGQFMLFRRDAYDALGGHERVKSELLEDLAFARRIKWHHKDLRLGVFMAAGVFRCRMYRAWPAFRRGWKRIYTEAARRNSKRLSLNALRLAAIGGVLPFCAAAATVAGPVVMKIGDIPLGASMLATGAAGAYAFSGGIGRAMRAQGLAAWHLLLYPVGAAMTAFILREAANDLRRGRGTRWAGMEYSREARR